MRDNKEQTPAMTQPGPLKSTVCFMGTMERHKVKLKACKVVLIDIFWSQCGSGNTTNSQQKVSNITNGREVKQEDICGQVKQEDFSIEVRKDIDGEVTQDIEREVIQHIERGVIQEDRDVTEDISTDVTQTHVDRDVTQKDTDREFKQVDIVREDTQNVERYVTPEDIGRDVKQDDSDTNITHDMSRKVTHLDIGGEDKEKVIGGEDTTVLTVNSCDTSDCTCSEKEHCAKVNKTEQVVGCRVRREEAADKASIRDLKGQTLSNIQPDAVKPNDNLLPEHNGETHKVKLKACTVVMTDMYNCGTYRCAEHIKEPVGSDTANNLYSSRRRSTETRERRVVILATQNDIVGEETTKLKVKKLCDIEDYSHTDDVTRACVRDTEISPCQVSSVTHDDMSRENIIEVMSKSRDTRYFSESDNESEDVNGIQDPNLTAVDADKCEEKASSWSTVEIRVSLNELDVNTDRSLRTCDQQRRNGKTRRNHMKPHTCHICGVSFRKKCSLTRHINVHTVVKSHAVTWTGDDVNVSAVTLDDTGVETTAFTIHLRAARDVSYTDFSDDDADVVAEKSTCCLPRLATHDSDTDSRRRKCDQSTHGDRLLQCDTCEKSFGSTSNLNRHRRNRVCQKEQVTAYPCGICEKVFDNKRSRTLHDRTHPNMQRYSCETCGKWYCSLSSIKYHRLTHKGDRCHLCDTCGKTYLSKKYLAIHKRSHLAELPHPCSTCDKSFHYLPLLKQHENVHAGLRPFLCVMCGKSFSGVRHLRRHKSRVHGSGTPALCETCGKAFTTRDRLTQHMRSHSDERPYVCNICGASFKQPDALTVHKRIHTKEKPYACKICGKMFVTQSQIRTHEKSHTGEKPHACRICGKTFTLPHHRRAHEKTHARDTKK